MIKLVGYFEMKEGKGKVLHCISDENNITVGNSVSTEFAFGDSAKNISPDWVGKVIELTYRKGFNGQAQVSNVTLLK